MLHKKQWLSHPLAPRRRPRETFDKCQAQGTATDAPTDVNTEEPSVAPVWLTTGIFQWSTQSLVAPSTRPVIRPAFRPVLRPAFRLGLEARPPSG